MLGIARWLLRRVGLRLIWRRGVRSRRLFILLTWMRRGIWIAAKASLGKV